MGQCPCGNVSAGNEISFADLQFQDKVTGLLAEELAVRREIWAEVDGCSAEIQVKIAVMHGPEEPQLWVDVERQRQAMQNLSPEQDHSPQRDLGGEIMPQKYIPQLPDVSRVCAEVASQRRSGGRRSSLNGKGKGKGTRRGSDPMSPPIVTSPNCTVPAPPKWMTRRLSDRGLNLNAPAFQPTNNPNDPIFEYCGVQELQDPNAGLNVSAKPFFPPIEEHLVPLPSGEVGVFRTYSGSDSPVLPVHDEQARMQQEVNAFYDSAATAILTAAKTDAAYGMASTPPETSDPSWLEWGETAMGQEDSEHHPRSTSTVPPPPLRPMTWGDDVRLCATTGNNE